MPSTSPLQCLFCKHLNPAYAIFCNECGTQLNLPSCKQCGSIDDRAAEKCRKCGASLILAAQPEPYSLLGPAIPGEESASSTLSDAGPAGMLPTQRAHDRTHAPAETQWAAQTGSSVTDANATRSRRRWLVAIFVLLLALAIDVVFVHSYYGESGQLAQTKNEKTKVAKLAAPEVQGETKPDELTQPNAVIPVDATLEPEDKAAKSVTRPQVLEKVPSRAPPEAVAAMAVRPLPVTDSPVKIGQEPAVFEECPQAVATLGLCNAPTNK
jgi:ribosomal protein L40E